MCLLIAVEKGKLDYDSIESSFSNNQDGAGFAFVRDGEIIVEKGFFDERSFIRAYEQISETPHIIHFRRSTGGLVNTVNCHPFQPHSEVAFAHNGTLTSVKGDSHFSDTFYFSQGILTDILRHGGTKLVESTTFPWMLGQAIGANNKMAFLTVNNKIVIINEDALCAHWDEKVDSKIWFSNYTYCYSSYHGDRVYQEILPAKVENDVDAMDEDTWRKYVDALVTNRDDENYNSPSMQERYHQYAEAYQNQCGI
jgi:predicted glutamine amidotransferase